MKRKFLCVTLGIFGILCLAACHKDDKVEHKETTLPIVEKEDNASADSELVIGNPDATLSAEEIERLTGETDSTVTGDMNLTNNQVSGTDSTYKDTTEDSNRAILSQTDKKNEEALADTSVISEKVNGRTTDMYVKLSDYGSIMTVRADASTSSESIGMLVHAEKVKVYSVEGDWAKIKYKTGYGYCKIQYLVDTRPEYLSPTPKPSSAPTETPTEVPATSSEENSQSTDANTQDNKQDTTKDKLQDTSGLTQEEIEEMREMPPEI